MPFFPSGLLTGPQMREIRLVVNQTDYNNLVNLAQIAGLRGDKATMDYAVGILEIGIEEVSKRLGYGWNR